MKTTAICLTMSFCLLSGSSLARGEEPVEQYLQGLKDRGYFDIALEYLEEAAANGAITLELRERLDFERGTILLEGIRFVRDGNQRQANLDRAEQLLEEFIKDHPRHPLASFAQRRLSDLFVFRARLAMANSKSKESDEVESKQLVEQAREFYQRASDAVNVSRAGVKELLIALDPAIADPATKQLVRKYQDEYLRVRFIIGMIPEEMADTYPKNSMAWGMYLEQAIGEYDDYARDYRTKPIASRARLYQARCHDKLGNEEESMKYINEVLDLPDDPVFYEIKRDACLLAVKTWFAAKPPQYLLAIQEIYPLVDSVSPNELRGAEWLALQFWLAKAYHGFAEEMMNKADKSREDIEQQSIAEKRSRELLRQVARYPNDFKQEALDLLVALYGGPKVAGEMQEEEAGNVTDASPAVQQHGESTSLTESTFCEPLRSKEGYCCQTILRCPLTNSTSASARSRLIGPVANCVCQKRSTAGRCWSLKRRRQGVNVE